MDPAPPGPGGAGPGRLTSPGPGTELRSPARPRAPCGAARPCAATGPAAAAPAPPAWSSWPGRAPAAPDAAPRPRPAWTAVVPSSLRDADTSLSPPFLIPAVLPASPAGRAAPRGLAVLPA